MRSRGLGRFHRVVQHTLGDPELFDFLKWSITHSLRVGLDLCSKRCRYSSSMVSTQYSRNQKPSRTGRIWCWCEDDICFSGSSSRCQHYGHTEAHLVWATIAGQVLSNMLPPVTSKHCVSHKARPPALQHCRAQASGSNIIVLKKILKAHHIHELVPHIVRSTEKSHLKLCMQIKLFFLA
ncbi:unnamed protein product [Albugo candida]|uniref:Uncharacterized protein n=1 Tax=Albugo candida TaxID=65357 RepID=A0A024GRE1_9STRA|nr:unnamed protein product [Albugo candida]|eukprot:CCI49139.1 unnamed protein product [Albugo candida]